MGYARTHAGRHWTMARGPRSFVITQFPGQKGWYWAEHGQPELHGPYVTKREIVKLISGKPALRLKAPLALAEAV